MPSSHVVAGTKSLRWLVDHLSIWAGSLKTMVLYHHAFAENPAQQQRQHIRASDVQDVCLPDQFDELRERGPADDAEREITLVGSFRRIRRDYGDLHFIVWCGLGESLGQFHGYGFDTTNHRRECVCIDHETHRKAIYVVEILSVTPCVDASCRLRPSV